MLFKIPELIEFITQGITLEPGDIIATGTPSGVGLGFDPPRWLHPGDRVEVTIEPIGTLRSVIVE
jgi:2-keto-4-pentenoate hydratase/2-oxohepta-3-ene-1,7-dioic acid hydratase in catechol pathway